MVGLSNELLQLLCLIIAAIIIQHVLHRCMHRSLGPKGYRGFMFIGALVHEIAHELSAIVLLNARNTRISIFESSDPKVLGEMHFSYQPSLLSTLLMPVVSFAPLLIGLAITVPLLSYFLDLPLAQLPQLQYNSLLPILESQPWSINHSVLLVVFVMISSTMTPSSQDVKFAVKGLLLWTGLIAVGLWIQPVYLVELEKGMATLNTIMMICVFINVISLMLALALLGLTLCVKATKRNLL